MLGSRYTLGRTVDVVQVVWPWAALHMFEGGKIPPKKMRIKEYERDIYSIGHSAGFEDLTVKPAKPPPVSG